MNNEGVRLWVCLCGHLWLYASTNQENSRTGRTHSECCLCLEKTSRLHGHLQHCRTPGHDHPERADRDTA